ncbi:hypothetical protein T4B_1964 [Trichinella pseudospiralis]|uniref:Uncharacterized protein n=1 Tax=Trichinella pseudospiralis TaxID=6337 RepID=A0A0V1J4W0_TRIPS|nr:hypothetical protein T4B_1964 [Trichinella pseudospiralis]
MLAVQVRITIMLKCFVLIIVPLNNTFENRDISNFAYAAVVNNNNNNNNNDDDELLWPSHQHSRLCFSCASENYLGHWQVLSKSLRPPTNFTVLCRQPLHAPFLAVTSCPGPCVTIVEDEYIFESEVDRNTRHMMFRYNTENFRSIQSSKQTRLGLQRIKLTDPSHAFISSFCRQETNGPPKHRPTPTLVTDSTAESSDDDDDDDDDVQKDVQRNKAPKMNISRSGVRVDQSYIRGCAESMFLAGRKDFVPHAMTTAENFCNLLPRQMLLLLDSGQRRDELVTVCFCAYDRCNVYPDQTVVASGVRVPTHRTPSPWSSIGVVPLLLALYNLISASHNDST